MRRKVNMHRMGLSAVLGAIGLCLFAGAALAAGPVTTLEQQLDIWSAVIPQVEKNPATALASLPSLIPQYGNWCGLGTTAFNAPAVDDVDCACRSHDQSPGYSSPLPTLEQVVRADRQFVADLSQAAASTPYGELYREGAIQVMEAKTTYEQANQTILLGGCSDCRNIQ